MKTKTTKLETQIAAVLACGSIKTLSLKEALESDDFSVKSFTEEELKERYGRGQVVCIFQYYQGTFKADKVVQIATFPHFIQFLVDFF